MSRWDEVKKLRATAQARIDGAAPAELAAETARGVQRLAEAAESVAKRSGLANKNGDISRLRVAKAAMQPRKTVLRAIDATVDEVRSRRESSAEGPSSEPG